jgi:transposase
MRKGFDGLMRVATEQAARDVFRGGLFVFVKRRRDRVKLLWWGEDGLAIWYKFSRCTGWKTCSPAAE